MNSFGPDRKNPPDAAALKADQTTHAKKPSEESERWLRAAVQNSSDIVMILEADATIRYVSPAVERVLGYRPEDFVGTIALDYVHPEDLEYMSKSFAETLKKPGVQLPVEYRIRTADGSWRHMEAIRSNWLDDPEVAGLVANVRDVTERKEAEEALKKSEERFRSLVQNSSDVITVTDVDGTILYDSPAVERVLGYKPEERAGTNAFDYIGPSELEQMTRMLEEIMASPGARLTEEMWWPHKDGTSRYLEVTPTNLLEDPAVGGIVINWRDITARKQAEETLRESEERFRSTFDEASIGMAVNELDGRYVQVNRSLYEMLGYSEEELLATTFQAITHPDDLEADLDHVRRMLDGEINTFQTEKRYLHADGHVVWVSLNASVVRGPEGHPLYFIAQIQDITERKAGEEEKTRQARHAALRAEVNVALAEGGTMERILQRCTKCMVRHLGVAFARIWTLNEEENVLELRASAGMYTRLDGTYSRVPVGEYKIGLIAQECLPHLTNDVLHDPRVDDKEWAERKGMVSFAGHPLVVEDRLVGVMGMFALEPLEEDTIEALASVANVIAQGIKHKWANEALRRSETNLAEAQRIAHLGSWEWNLKTGEVWWSDEAYCIYGFEPQQFSPTLKTVEEVFHPDDRHLFRAAIEDAYHEADSYDFEHRIVRPGGEVRWIHRRGEVVRGEGGEPLRMIGTVHDITEQKALEERLEYQAFHDLLTDLPNRQLFMDRLKQALRRTRRRSGRKKVAVLFMDLDNFKVVNDSLGHEVGDRLLVAVGERIRGSLRSEDTLARFGGDEFTVLVENVENPADAVRVAERIIEANRERFVLAKQEIFTKLSIGISLGDANATSSPEEMLRNADTAMYQAKKEGLLGYRVFEPVMHEQALRRLKLQNELRRAVESEEFVVHYQPIVDFESGEVRRVEALVRWQHPKRGLLEPSEFLSDAEKSGLVIPMGEQVLEEACRQGQRWQEEDSRIPPLVVSVNLSVKQLSHPDLVKTVEQVLRETGFEASRLSLDITETVYMKVLEGNTAALDALKRLGVCISIDDFGVGYSSLSYLKRLPADVLKIDKSFIAGIGVDKVDTVIVRMIIDLAHTLGMEVVAEGVESEGQAQQLKEIGCDLGQGYYIAKPLSPEAVPDFLIR